MITSSSELSASHSTDDLQLGGNTFWQPSTSDVNQWVQVSGLNNRMCQLILLVRLLLPAHTQSLLTNASSYSSFLFSALDHSPYPFITIMKVTFTFPVTFSGISTRGNGAGSWVSSYGLQMLEEGAWVAMVDLVSFTEVGLYTNYCWLYLCHCRK